MRARRWLPYALIAPAALWLLLFFVIPFYSLLANSLFDPTGDNLTGYDVTFHFANFTHVLSKYGPHIWRAFWWATISTALCLVLGYVLAYTIAFKAGRWKNIVLVLVVAPFFTEKSQEG